MHFAANRICFAVEELLVPRLHEIETDLVNTAGRVIFVLGHARSGTTNVHKALCSLDGVTASRMYHLLVPSLILKYAFAPLSFLLDRFFFKNLVNSANVPNHKIGLNEELEEHHYAIHLFFGDAFASYLFPTLGADIFEQCMRLKDEHLIFIRKCMARSLYYEGTQDQKYVGQPLGLSVAPHLLRKHFPKAMIVVCVRDPRQSIPSYIDLVNNMSKAQFDQSFSKRMNENNYLHYCVPIYRGLAQWQDENTVWIDFE